MAITRNGNVIRKSAASTETYTGPVTICGIKLIPDGAGGTATIHEFGGSVAADVIWEASSTTSDVYEEVCIRDTEGLEITVTGTNSVLYLYSKIK